QPSGPRPAGDERPGGRAAEPRRAHRPGVDAAIRPVLRAAPLGGPELDPRRRPGRWTLSRWPLRPTGTLVQRIDALAPEAGVGCSGARGSPPHPKSGWAGPSVP